MPDTSARLKPDYVLAKKDVVEPVMSAADWDDLQRGLSLFHAHKFWDAHEAWELIWQRHKEPSRIFFQGLIQIAAACHQIQRGIFHGSMKHFNNALFKLTQFPEVFLTVDVVHLNASIVRCRCAVERLGEAGLAGFDANLFPVIVFVEPC